ncbi:MAG: class I SAM-dependent methyltransferase [Candidatus Xenobia bacterium]
MEFDRHAADYHQTLNRSLAGLGESIYFARLKADLLAHVLRARPAASVLDVGCGTGVAEQFLVGRVGQLTGCDVSEGMLAEARQRAPGVQFDPCPLEGPLPYEDATFEATFTACTLHHVPPPQRTKFVADMVRVTRPGGLVVTFEHNPHNPVTRAIVAGCEFDRDAVLLPAAETRSLWLMAGLGLVQVRYYCWFPARLGFLRGLEPLLSGVPLGGQYMVVGMKAIAGPAPGV